MTNAFPGRARADRVLRGPSAEAAGHRVVSDPHPIVVPRVWLRKRLWFFHIVIGAWRRHEEKDDVR